MRNTTAISGKEHADATEGLAAIRSEAELAKATRELCALMSRDDLSADEGNRFQQLVSIVEEYEEAHYPILEPSHAALLEHLLYAQKSTPAKLAKATRIGRRDIAAILDGKRDISATEAKVLARHFHVDESVFDGSAPIVRVQVITSSAGRAGLRVFGHFLAKATSVAQATELTRGLLSFGIFPRSAQGAIVPFESRFRLASS